MKVVLGPREDWFACTWTAQWVIGAAASHHRMNNSARRGHSTDGNGGTNGGGNHTPLNFLRRDAKLLGRRRAMLSRLRITPISFKQ